MWPANTPIDDPSKVWDLCLQGIQKRNKSIADALASAKTNVEEAHRAYLGAAGRGHFWGLRTTDFQCDGVTQAQTDWLYNTKLVGGNPRQRAVYNRIKSGAVDDLCPFCNHRDVYDLDHFLPKESFHLLAVNPWNLVPSCKECNVNKKAHKADQATNEFFHPYFNVPRGRWLGAEVRSGERPTLRFMVIAPDGWSEIDFKRAEFQFDRLKLDRLYRAQTGAEIRVLASSLLGIFRSGGPEGAGRVRRKLAELADEREPAGKNDWKLAMYTAMAESDWYCQGGFANGAATGA